VATYSVETTTFLNNKISLTFPFIDPSHVKVKYWDGTTFVTTLYRYNNDEQWNSNLSNTDDYPRDAYVYRIVLISNVYYIQFSRPFSNATIIIYRETPNYIPSFVNGSALTAEDLNSAFTQLSYQAEEKDQVDIASINVSLAGKFDKTGGTISGATTINSNLSMGGNRIENVATPVSANQVATKQYVDLANSVGGVPTILSDSITATQLSKVSGSQAVSTATIQDQAVTANKIANLTITADKIVAGTITADKMVSNLSLSLNTGSIKCATDGTSNPLYESTTTSTSNSANSRRPVTSDTIRALAITTSKIADGSVTNSKMATDSVTTSNIVNLNVTGDKIANSTIPSSKLLASGFNFTSTGALTAQDTSVASLTSTGDIKAPSWANLKLTNTWSSIDPTSSYVNGFFPYYRPVVNTSTGQYDFTQPPRTYLKSATSNPFRIILSYENLLRNRNLDTPKNTWSNVKLNRIIFNNTSFFNLASDGTMTIDNTSPGASGIYLIEGWSECTNATQGNILYTNRISGAGWSRVALSSGGFTIDSYSSSAWLCYGSLEEDSGSYNNKRRSSIQGCISSSNSPFKFQEYAHTTTNFTSVVYSANPAVQSNNTSAWYDSSTNFNGAGPLVNWDVSSNGRFYGTFGYLSITKISDVPQGDNPNVPFV
jgi:hypothetical protein